jgi:hypothetical protein
MANYIEANSWYVTHYGSQYESKQQLVYVVKFHGTPTTDSIMAIWYQPKHGWTFFESVPMPNWDWKKYAPTERDWQVALASVFQHWGEAEK